MVSKSVFTVNLCDLPTMTVMLLAKFRWQMSKKWHYSAGFRFQRKPFIRFCSAHCSALPQRVKSSVRGVFQLSHFAGVV
jgi:hypothetical protein